MLLKVHDVDFRGTEEIIVCVCDAELIGKTYSQGEKELWVNPRFYGGDESTDEEIVEALKNATIINFVGNESVAFGIVKGYIEEDSIIKIDGVPHAQVVFMK